MARIEKKAKSGGCKIVDIRNRSCFLYPGTAGCLGMHLEIEIKDPIKQKAVANCLWILVVKIEGIERIYLKSFY